MRFKQYFENITPIDQLTKDLEVKYPGLRLHVSENDMRIFVHEIFVDPTVRNQGIGSAALQAIQDYAVQVNKPIVLSPSPDRGKKSALNRFYSNLGFVKNSGRNTDYRLSSSFGPTMLWRPRFKNEQYLENGMYYHGSHQPIDQFQYTFLGSGKGYNQEGPGFYFTSDESDAKIYGHNLFHAKIHLNKPVPLKGKPKRREIEVMIKNAPDLEDTLTNWDENPNLAFRKAVAAISDQPNPHQAFQSVWYDFYRGHEQDYLKNMVGLLGYDGVVVPRANGIQHIIVFDPSLIQRVN